jgi:hypothetical protein
MMIATVDAHHGANGFLFSVDATTRRHGGYS